jgi:HEPN domain-containing protein
VPNGPNAPCYDALDARSVSMNRWSDWWQQAARDLAHARHAAEDGDYEWAAFAAQQAAEKALKALVMAHGGEPWGHLLTSLAEGLPDATQAPPAVLDAARRLDKHYVPARYPNGFASGYPGMLYTRGEAEQAIDDASAIIEFCGRGLPR